MKKMALFGGTFDPIHTSHVSMALRLAASLHLDGVVLMPAYVPPHKIRESLAPAEDRLAMCRLVAAEHPVLSVSDMEIRRGGASFTVDTLTALREQYPDTQWYLLTGADMFRTLHSWYRFADIAGMAVLCTVPRDDVTAAELRQYAATLEKDGATCYVDDQPEQPISSTEIRRRVLAGGSLAGLVPPSVEEYIVRHGLYRQEGAMENRSQEEQFKEILRTRLGDYRYRHSLCVADEAERLAKKYGADPVRLRTAGLLHDIMKDTDPAAQLQILADFGILLDDVEKAVPKLWHARTGAVFLEKILHIDDPQIITAVRYHTTGRAGMSLAEKVLFMADFTSADRDYDDVDTVRELVEQSLEAAMEYAVAYTVEDLVHHGRAIHPDTVALYNELILQKKPE